MIELPKENAHDLHTELVQEFGDFPPVIDGEVDWVREVQWNEQIGLAAKLLRELVGLLRAASKMTPEDRAAVRLRIAQRWNEAREKSGWLRLSILRLPSAG